MDNMNFVISLKFKGQNEVEKLFNKVGEKHEVDLSLDTSKIKASIENLQSPISSFALSKSLKNNT